MGAPYSLDLRERVVAAVATGMSGAEAAKRFQVSPSSVFRWTRRVTETGTAAASPMGGRKPFRLAREEAWIRARVEEKPDLTGRELLAELNQRGIKVSHYAVWHFLDRLGLTFKKKPSRQRTRPSRRGAKARAMEGPTGQRRRGAPGLP